MAKQYGKLPTQLLRELDPGEFELNMMILNEGLRQERGGKAVRVVETADPHKEAAAIIKVFELIGKPVRDPKKKAKAKG